MSNAEILQAAYEAFGRGDFEAAFADLDENCVWNSGSDLLPAGGTFHGKAEIMGGWLPEFGANFSDFELKVDEILESGDRVFVLGTEHATIASSEVHGPFCHVWLYRDGKAIEASFFGQEAQTLNAVQHARAATA
jgi:ketosteroid isomerase-like protein